MEPMFIVAATEEKPDVKTPTGPTPVKSIAPQSVLPDVGDASGAPSGREERVAALAST